MDGFEVGKTICTDSGINLNGATRGLLHGVYYCILSLKCCCCGTSIWSWSDNVASWTRLKKLDSAVLGIPGCRGSRGKLQQ